MGRVCDRLGTQDSYLPEYLCMTVRPWADHSNRPVGFAQLSGQWWTLKHILKSLELGFE